VLPRVRTRPPRDSKHSAAASCQRGNRQWVVTAYTLSFGGLLLLGGWIADYVGDLVHNAFQEHWGADIHQYGVLGGVGHGARHPGPDRP
jgi:hypothetical protein